MRYLILALLIFMLAGCCDCPEKPNPIKPKKNYPLDKSTIMSIYKRGNRDGQYGVDTSEKLSNELDEIWGKD